MGEGFSKKDTQHNGNHITYVDLQQSPSIMYYRTLYIGDKLSLGGHLDERLP